MLFLGCIVSQPSLNSNYSQYRCGANKKKFKPTRVPLDQIAPSKKGNKRALDSEFHDFNIYLDLKNFDDEVKKYNLKKNRELYVKGMQKAIKTLQTLLKVKSTSNHYFYDYQITQLDINNWDKTKIGSELAKQKIGMEDLGIDLYIFAKFEDKAEIGENIYARAGAYYLDPLTDQPLIGIVEINKDMDFSKKNSLQFLEGIMLHEFTHILGFDNYYFTEVYHNYFTKKDAYGIERAYINSPKVVKVAKKYFNCETLEGVELENIGGEGTAGTHWESRILLGEYMTGYVDTLDQAISEFTLALLEDSGYYKANYFTGGLMQYGRNKGCEFLNTKCVNDLKINPKFSNEFFYNMNRNTHGLDSSCSSGRQSRGYQGIFDYNYVIPKEFQYFNSKYRGGMFHTDYCPVTFYSNAEQKKIYNTGRCSEIGDEIYGSEIPYRDFVFYTSGEIKSKTGEYLSNNSFCVLSTLISTKIRDYKLYSSTLRAVCFRMHCSERSLTIQIGNNFLVCPRAGGKINSPGFDGYLLCPDYNLICSGTVLCNDMFDCVEKKSLLKELKYDYESRTTQNYAEINKEKIEEDSYELSTNGKCPKFCHQCNEKGECLVCKGGMFLDKEKKCQN